MSEAQDQAIADAHGTGWKPGRGSAPGKFAVGDVVYVSHETVDYKYWWNQGWWGDQGFTSECVIYSWLHALHDSPVTRPGMPKPLANPTALYREGQTFDGTPHWDVDSGLTMDAGAKVMRSHGYIREYRWADDLDDVLDALTGLGQVTIGCWWRAGMDAPNAKGVVAYTGRPRGGHQFVANGFNKKHRLVRCKNSWGRAWGKNGSFWLPFDAVTALLNDDGAACVARELAAVRV
jgi:hypothetical protein